MNEHIDADTLALIALGEPAGSGDEEHLRTCDACQAEVAAFARVRTAASTLDEGDRSPPAPSPALWEAIERAVADETPAPAEHTVEGVRHRDEDHPAEVVDLRARSRWRQATTALAVAASLLIGIVVGTTLWQPDETVDVEVVADTELEALVEGSAGSARLVRAEDAFHLEVDPPDLPPTDGYYALWLIDRDVAGMISLGPLEADRTYALPAGFDPESFPVVDVSIEPFDGDPTHSGNSVLRGVLPLQS